MQDDFKDFLQHQIQYVIDPFVIYTWKEYHLQMNQWVLALIAILYLGFQNLYVAGQCGLMAGIIVQGVACWGFRLETIKHTIDPEKVKKD